jgi:uncharacterized Zn finger protein
MAWFSVEDLQALAGPRSYQRGTGYLDAVADLGMIPGGVQAIVHGTEPYRVRLLREDGELTGACDCPVGVEGTFCKHCVALGLVVLSAAELADPEPAEPGNRAGGQIDLHGYLESLDHATLVELLHEHALDDEALSRRLRLRAARQHAGGQPDTVALGRQIDRALRTRGFTSYHGSFDYARRAQEILDTLQKLLDAGHARLVIPLAERALALIIQASEQMDDSAGAVADAASGMLALHAAACRAAPPDPEVLARWLIDLRLNGPGWPEVELEAYWDALGPHGQAAYRRQVEGLWAKRPPPPVDRPPIYGHDDHRRFVVTRLMEQLAQLDQDTDRLVQIIAADLSSGWQYVRIANLLRDADRAKDALAWAERGLRAATSERYDPRLVDLAADLYQQAGRTADAVRLRRDVFERDPTQATYQALREISLATGRWSETRDQALKVLRARPARDGGSANATLVRVLLDEQRHDDAWTAAREGGCTDDLWLALAERRAIGHPADAIGVYRRLVEAAVGQGTKDAYREAAALAERIRRLHQRAGTLEAFPSWLDGLKARHKRKRNLMAELDRRGL